MYKQLIKKVPISKKLFAMLPYILLTLGGCVMIFPLLYSILGSLSTKAEYAASVFLPLPKNPIANLKNFAIIFQAGNLLMPFIITVSRIIYSVAITVIISSMLGYLFAKVNFAFKNVAFIVLLSSMMIPGAAMMVPNYIFLSKFPLVGGNDILGNGGNGFINNPAMLFVLGWVNVYSIFLFRQAFATLGNEMAESGELDGAGFLTIVFRLYLPLVMPIIALLTLNAFLGGWNDYMTSLIYLPNYPSFTLLATKANDLIVYYTQALNVGGADYPKAFAISTVMMIPPIIMFLFLQKGFVEGLAMGAVKG